MSTIIDGSAGVTTNTGAVYNGIQAATAVASTSGTSIDFTSIPSWVKRITVMFYRMSTNGTSLPILRVGTSGGVVSTGYETVVGYSSSAGTFATDSTSFVLACTGAWGASSSYSGLVILSNVTGNNWSGIISAGSYSIIQVSGGGSVTLGGTLDRVRITTSGGTDTFDAGSINILYE